MDKIIKWSLLCGFTLVMAAGVAGCRDATAASETPPAPADPTRTYVENLLTDLDGELRQHAEAVATGKALTSYVSREASRSWNARVDGGIKYADLLEKLYEGRDEHKAYAQSDGLTSRGKTVLEVLLDSERHALDSSPYHVARIQTLLARLERDVAGEKHWQPVELSAEEANALVDWMRRHDLEPDHPQTRTRLLNALVGTSQEAGAKTQDKENQAQRLDSPAPRITEQMQQYFGAFEQTAEQTAELELRVIDGALRYARDMRHFNLARQDWRDLRDAGGSKALIYGRLEKTFEELSRHDAEGAEQVMHALAPAHPQYAKLLDVLARYRALAADGGWQRVRPTKVELGARSPRVEALRERLAAEGFLSTGSLDAELLEAGSPSASEPDEHEGAPTAGHEADEDTGDGAADAETTAAEQEEEPRPDPMVVDEALIEAVESYQETHQFRPDGKPTAGFWRSLNLPVSRRIEQIELAIQRWRESQYQGERDFIMVNIPDFHAEVFRDGKRQMRFRVVTGNNNRTCDRDTGKWVYPNATPVQMAELDHIIVNPYWYVPERIVREEIEPKLRDDPDYLDKKGYEKVTMGGKETIRQKPGEGNALGRVKFIFPNVHNTYMHDTPHKKYFEFPVRAYSHGCMRVHTPIELARHLLDNDPKGKSFELDDLLESDRQKYIELADKLPVFTEYITVRVDDQGRPQFLADVYDHDEVRLADDPDEVQDCRRKTRAKESPTHSQEVPEEVDQDLGP
ncbi:MAG: L,D-transpeptidase family protein [Persicimonas sp.]